MKQISNIAGLALLAMALLGALAGCKRDQNNVQGPATALLVDDASIALPATKVHRTGFDAQDSIAFYAVRFTGTTPNEIAADATTYINHKLYIKRASDLLFASWNGTAFVDEYFPNDGSSIDIYGFYPYNPTAPADYTNYNFPVRANQSGASSWNYNKSDFMAAKTPSIRPTATPNKLVFNHLLSRMVVNVNLINFPAISKVQEVTILGVNTHTRLNLRAYDPATGILGQVLSSSTPTNVTPYTEPTPAVGFSHTATAIIAPQSLVSGKKVVEISVWDGAKSTKYNLTLTEDLALQSGKEHTFSLTIDQGSRPNINVNPVITAWGTLNATGEGVKASDHRFITTLSNEGGVAVGQIAQVKVGVNGNRTFTLPATFSATGGVGGAAAIMWEFRGSGNRPIDYPFEIRSIEFVSNVGASLGGKNTATPGVAINQSDASETVALGLSLDMATKTFVRSI